MQHPQEDSRKQCAHLNKKMNHTQNKARTREARAGAVRPRARLRQGRKLTPVSGYTEWLTLSNQRPAEFVRTREPRPRPPHETHLDPNDIEDSRQTPSYLKANGRKGIFYANSNRKIADKADVDLKRLRDVKKKVTC